MRTFGRWMSWVAAGAAAVAGGFVLTGAVPGADPAAAQIRDGTYWLHQPHQQGPVGRAWCSGDGTTEYWAYVHGEYVWPGAGNGPSSPWRLDAARVAGSPFGSYEAWKDTVLDLPEFEGKTIVFQAHTVAEETVGN